MLFEMAKSWSDIAKEIERLEAEESQVKSSR
jgi:hypothetical protein